MISNLAFVHPDAKLGNNVTVEPFAYVAGDVVLGDDCWIGPGAVIMDGARMGKGCKVHTGAVISGVPQDLKFKGEYTTTEIGDYNTFRESCTVNRGTASKGKTVIGDHNLVMAYAHIAHDCVIGSHCVIVNSVSLAGEVEVGDWVVFGGHSGAHQFCRIGEHAMIGANTYVNKDVPPYVKAAHTPITYVGANFLGLRRRGFEQPQISQIQDMFRVLFQDGHTYSQACDLVMSQFPQSRERDLVVNFIRESKRGILKPYNRNIVADTE
ncbi:MAG: acyl-ACP--UDP-N-acetylglucosamine O-acyltransferase [Tidjanibacter sp.]|mgnify:CR=1 FL=1|nr:acyl-ACP--UDP-N-acetylglucosamine O-acyltransferase [Tidjanibacter sp.]MBR6830837.1 acyl-ACP--UDP-N-acetylglucosamine O-acyltransferase [Tidjanibacter sp.]